MKSTVANRLARIYDHAPLFAVIVSLCATAAAQQAPKVEAFGGYSYLNVDVPAIPSAGVAGDRLNTNGWGASASVYFFSNRGGPLLDMSDHAMGVITWDVNLELGQNLTFAIPGSEVKLLVIASQQPKPLDSVASKGDGLTNGTLWTSLTSGHDYSIRQDGDYLYVDWVNIPPHVKTAGGFLHGEMKQSSDGKWRGQNHARLPCKYLRGHGVFTLGITNWCSAKTDIEIDILSEKRIEGISTHSRKFNCRTCEAKGEVEQTPFTWVPK